MGDGGAGTGIATGFVDSHWQLGGSNEKPGHNLGAGEAKFQRGPGGGDGDGRRIIVRIGAGKLECAGTNGGVTIVGVQALEG